MVFMARLAQLRPLKQLLFNHHGQQQSSSLVRPPWTSFNLTATTGNGGAAGEKEGAERDEGVRESGGCGDASSRYCPLSQGLFQWGAALALGFHLLHGRKSTLLSPQQQKNSCPSAFLGAALRALYIKTDEDSVILRALPFVDQEYEEGKPVRQLATHIASQGDKVVKVQPSDEAVCSEKETNPLDSTKVSVESAGRDLRRVHDRLLARCEAKMGLEMLLQGEEEAGMDLLRAAADLGDAEATHNLGVAYEMRMESLAALQCYRKAAELGNASSVYNLAIFHQQGLAGLEVDAAKAAELFKTVEAMEEREKKNGLQEDDGCSFCVEEGWERDEGMRASEPNIESTYRLGRAHHFGLGGLPVDKSFALMLYRTAAEGGHGEAAKAFALLRRELLVISSPSLRYSKSAPELSPRQEHLLPRTGSVSCFNADRERDEIVATNSWSVAAF